MQLYGSPTSPFVRHCRIALMQENIKFEFIEATPEIIAKKSPTRKVPFMIDGELVLTDSSSILRHTREKAGNGFMPEIKDYELFAMTNTILDSALNLFLLEMEGVTPETTKYLAKQQSRIKSGLIALNSRIDATYGIRKDSNLRCACFIDWALFRNRISLDNLPNLQALLDNANDIEIFVNSGPPR